MAKSSSSKKSLVIVESPAKAKTINKYLGSDFEVKASMGHVRDLPKGKLNVDIENDFKPTYAIMPGKSKVATALKSAAKKCRDVYLATDLDREGEAIAWHLAQILGVPDEKTYRVIFNAITPSAIKQAFANPGKIDMDKVMAQRARQILDKIIGYQISPLLWKKVAWGLSAGRVQSIAAKLIVEREREIREFKPEEYWLIPAIFTTDMQANYRQEWLDFACPKTQDDKPPTLAEQNKWLAEHNAFKSELYKVGDEKFHASTKKEAGRIFNALKDAEFRLADRQTKRLVSQPPAPFITSTLQQAAANRLGFATKRTMRVAQQLYEGIDLGSMGFLGLITYMRTDSTHLSSEAVAEVRKYIGTHLGSDYLPKEAKVYAAGKNAQQAHEAIRPTDIDLTPSDIKPFLTDEQYKLYDLIWRRFIACQMEAATWNVTNLNIAAETSLGCCWYRTSGRVLVFDGFTRIWPVASTEQELPAVKAGQKLSTVDIRAEQHFTKPPARFTEAALVKALEKEGIGRPSTYAPIISTIQERGYVEQTEKKFFATDLGEVVTGKLDDYFPKIMEIAFTRYVEEQLDRIEEQHLDWLGVLKDFYGPFKQTLDTAQAQMEHTKAVHSEYKCPKCGQQLIFRFGKNKWYMSCSGHPTCKFSCPRPKDATINKEVVDPKENLYLRMPIERVRSDAKYGVRLAQKAWRQLESKEAAKFLGEIVTEESEYGCPQCGKPLVYKFGKNGRFLSCSTYPQCTFACPCDPEGKMIEEKLSEHACPQCGKPMVHKSGRFGPFLGCSDYPDCKTTLKLDKQGNVLPPKPPAEPTGLKCHKCKQGELVIRQSKKGPFMGCSRFPKCRTIVSIKQLDHLKQLQSAGQWPPETPEQAEQLLGSKKAKETAKARK